jgi:hypothetical protein
MDVHIGEVNSTVRATDADALLSPQVLERIVKAVLERMREEHAHEKRIADERRLRPDALAEPGQDWR